MKDALQIQPLVKALMTTLLEDFPTLLDESDRSNLADRRYCQTEMKLTISYPVLIRGETPRNRERFYVKKIGDFFVCSQWNKAHHESNAQGLLNFVDGLLDRKAEHPSVQELHQHREAFERYVRSASQIPEAAGTRRAVNPGSLRPSPAPASHPRNQILYGPPGTGKTYSTVSHALAIVDGVKPNAEIAEADRQRFRRLSFKRTADSAPAEGRVAMVTFHQNYAYEDFVEGIRPWLTESGVRDGESETAGTLPSSELDYELRPGIFREICKAAETEQREAASEGLGSSPTGGRRAESTTGDSGYSLNTAPAGLAAPESA